MWCTRPALQGVVFRTGLVQVPPLVIADNMLDISGTRMPRQALPWRRVGNVYHQAVCHNDSLCWCCPRALRRIG